MTFTARTRHWIAFRAMACVLCGLQLSACRTRPSRPVPLDSSATTTAPVPASTATLARIPRDAARFEIEVVDDSTARFKPREASWVKAGMDVYAVDPLDRDALVARLRITSVWNETAVALVTSQVTSVKTQHVILMIPPTTPWWKSRRFWLGTLLGGAVGGTAGVLTVR